MRKLRNVLFLALAVVLLAGRVHASSNMACASLVGLPEDCTCVDGPVFGVNYTVSCDTSDVCSAFWSDCTHPCWNVWDEYDASYCDGDGKTDALCYLCVG
jgi:hypothetical protein